MKFAADIVKKMLPAKGEPKLCHYISVIGDYQKIDPTMSDQLTCLFCGGGEHYTCLIELERTWLCSNIFCPTMAYENMPRPSSNICKQNRAIPWIDFCHRMGLPKDDFEVTFEKINQDQAKKDYLKKALDKADGLILMQGTPGTGKTYMATAACEYFTRTNSSCYLISQSKLFDNYLDKTIWNTHYQEKLENYGLLVIDDFGDAIPTAGFLGKVKIIIENRSRNHRITIITTNLENEKLVNFAGDILADRLQRGQKFVFKGGSRREKIII